MECRYFPLSLTTAAPLTKPVLINLLLYRKSCILDLAQYTHQETENQITRNLALQMACWISEIEELFLAHTYSKRSKAKKLLTFEDRSFLTQAREGLEPYFRWQAIKNQTNPSPTVARSQQSTVTGASFARYFLKGGNLAMFPTWIFPQVLTSYLQGQRDRCPHPCRKRLTSTPCTKIVS